MLSTTPERRQAYKKAVLFISLILIGIVIFVTPIIAPFIANEITRQNNEESLKKLFNPSPDSAHNAWLACSEYARSEGAIARLGHKLPADAIPQYRKDYVKRIYVVNQDASNTLGGTLQCEVRSSLRLGEGHIVNWISTTSSHDQGKSWDVDSFKFLNL